jgi:hypothetical protein
MNNNKNYEQLKIPRKFLSHTMTKTITTILIAEQELIKTLKWLNFKLNI